MQVELIVMMITSQSDAYLLLIIIIGKSDYSLLVLFSSFFNLTALINVVFINI